MEQIQINRGRPKGKGVRKSNFTLYVTDREKSILRRFLEAERSKAVQSKEVRGTIL